METSRDGDDLGCSDGVGSGGSDNGQGGGGDYSDHGS